MFFSVRLTPAISGESGGGQQGGWRGVGLHGGGQLRQCVRGPGGQAGHRQLLTEEEQQGGGKQGIVAAP